MLWRLITRISEWMGQLAGMGRMNWVAHMALMSAKADLSIMYMTMDPPQAHLKRMYTRVAECCTCQPSRTLSTAGGVYALVHMVSDAWYAGRGKLFIARWRTHGQRYRSPSQLHIYTHMRSIGGLHQFVMLPLSIAEIRYEQITVERWFIQMYRPVLNSAFTSKYHQHIMKHIHKGTRAGPRPHKHQRDKHKDQLNGEPLYPLITYTRYKLLSTGQYSKVLDVVLNTAYHRNELDCSIEVELGTVTLNQSRLLSEKYYKSTLSVQYGDQAWSETNTMQHLATTQRGITTAIFLQFQNLCIDHKKRLHKLFLQQCLRSKTLIGRLHTVTLDTFMDLYDAAGHFSNPKTQLWLKTRLRTWCKTRLKMDFQRHFCLKLKFSGHIQLNKIQTWLHELFETLPHSKRTIHFLRNRVRVVFTDLLKIQRLLCNYKKAAKTHDKDAHYTCNCSNFPDTIKDRNGHVNCADHTFAANEAQLAVLTVNSKNAVKPDMATSEIDITNAINTFIVSQLAQFFGPGNLPTRTLEILEALPRTIKTFITPQDANDTGFYTENDVKYARNKLRSFVVSPMDKNVGCLNIMCEKAWHLRYENLFGDPQHYKDIPESEPLILAQQEREFNRLQLDMIADWNDMGTLPIAYFLVKFKNLDTDRPVLAVCNHPSKIACGVCAKGGTLLIKAATFFKHFNISQCKQLWRALFDPAFHRGEYFVVGFDIKQMFTMLGHTEVETAVMGFIEDMKQHLGHQTTFHVHKYGPEAKHARFGPAPDLRQCYQATFEDIWKALDFEMSNMFFKVGGSIKQQRNGLGIGGKMSPLGACATCIYFEYRWLQSISSTLHSPLRGARHVDDLLMVIHIADLHVIQNIQTHCYPPSLELKNDHLPGYNVKALECEVSLPPEGGMHIVSRNKNEDSLINEGSMKFVRYPHWKSYCEKKIKRNLITGSIHRFVANTLPQSYHMLTKPIWLFISELRLVQYPWNFIKHTIRHMDIAKLPIVHKEFPRFKQMWTTFIAELETKKDN
jgi:hypothetical protein